MSTKIFKKLFADLSWQFQIIDFMHRWFIPKLLDNFRPHLVKVCASEFNPRSRRLTIATKIFRRELVLNPPQLNHQFFFHRAITLSARRKEVNRNLLESEFFLLPPRGRRKANKVLYILDRASARAR